MVTFKNIYQSLCVCNIHVNLEGNNYIRKVIINFYLWHKEATTKMAHDIVCYHLQHWHVAIYVYTLCS